MSASEHHERHRRALDRTARTLREAAQKAGHEITHTEAQARVHQADAKQQAQERK
jgi:hypothetical protein